MSSFILAVVQSDGACSRPLGQIEFPRTSLEDAANLGNTSQPTELELVVDDALAHLGCTAGLRFSLGTAAVDVLHPAAAAGSRTAARENASSCVLRIASPAGSVLLSGDLPASAEAALVSATRTRR